MANGGYVQSLFHDLLNRSATPSEEDASPGPFETPSQRQALINAIMSGSEYRQQVVTGYYQRYLHRDPDTAERTFWSSHINPSSFDGPVLSGILGGDEYFANAGERFRIPIPALPGASQFFITIDGTPEVTGPGVFNGRIRSPDSELDPGDDRVCHPFDFVPPTVGVFVGSLGVQWPSGSDRYELEGAHDLNSAFWSQVPIPPTDDGTNVTVTIPTTGDQFFTRLRTPPFDRCLQDDVTGDRLAFNSVTGEYRLTRANGEFYAGSAVITLESGTLGLRHDTRDRHLEATLNTAAQQGQVVIETPPGTVRVSVVDGDTTNNDCP